jgi:ABC-2 type transport system permease protein
MINLLKMDFHRFFMNKMMYLLLIIFMAFQVFGIFMIKQYEQPAEQGAMLLSSMNESQFIQTMMSQTPSWVLMYITVFSVYFYMSEYNAGFYKNYIAMKNARIYSVISKVLILGLFTLLMFAVMLIADLIGSQIFFQNTSFGALDYFAKLLTGQFLLHWAFSIVILCITMLLKSLIPSIVIGIVLVLNVLGMAAAALESLIGDANLSSYMLVNTITNIKDFNNMQDIIHVASVAIIFILLFSLIAIKYKMKEDLR